MLETLSLYVIGPVCLFVRSCLRELRNTWTIKNGRRQILGFGVHACIFTYIYTPLSAQMRSLNVKISHVNARETFALQRPATQAPGHRRLAVDVKLVTCCRSDNPALDNSNAEDGHWRDIDVFAR